MLFGFGVHGILTKTPNREVSLKSLEFILSIHTNVLSLSILLNTQTHPLLKLTMCTLEPDFKRGIARIPGFTAASMTTWDVTKLIEIQNEKTRIENDAVQIVRSIESLLENAVKSKIPALKFQAEIWTSPFDTIEKTFEGTPESLLERNDLLPTLLDFDVILFLQEEASVRQTWNAKKTGGEAVSSTGSFHGDTPSNSNTNSDSASMQQEKKAAA